MMLTIALAAVQTILPLLPTIGGDVEKVIAWIEDVKSAAQQTGQWTPAIDAAYVAALLATRQNQDYQPD
jgi:hypothetical protein